MEACIRLRSGYSSEDEETGAYKGLVMVSTKYLWVKLNGRSLGEDGICFWRIPGWPWRRSRESFGGTGRKRGPPGWDGPGQPALVGGLDEKLAPVRSGRDRGALSQLFHCGTTDPGPLELDGTGPRARP